MGGCSASLREAARYGFDGKVIPRSTSQLRYVGKIGGLYTADPLEAAFAGAAVVASIDTFVPMKATFNEKDDKRKVRLSFVCKSMWNICLASRFICWTLWFCVSPRQNECRVECPDVTKRSAADLSGFRAVSLYERIKLRDSFPDFGIVDSHLDSHLD